MALSPPPRFRQSFQSARRPLQTPWAPTWAAEKSRIFFRCSYTVPSPPPAYPTRSSKKDSSPVSRTYSATAATSQRASSAQASARPCTMVSLSGVGMTVGDLKAGFSGCGPNQAGSKRCRP